jgi:hypothetical protein
MPFVSFRTERRYAVLLVVVVTAGCFTAHANTMYKVQRSIGAGSVTGCIETDGAMGVLGNSDFVDWNLLLSDGRHTFVLTGPLSGNNSSVFVRGTDVAAFDNVLLFNFSGIDFGVFFFGQGLFSGNHYYCDSSQPLECSQGETVVPLTPSLGSGHESLHGIAVIGTALPEPGTVGLFAGGLGVLMSSRKRLRPEF